MTKTTKICLNKEDRNEEFNNTTEIFKRNGYPRKIFEIARETTPEPPQQEGLVTGAISAQHSSPCEVCTCRKFHRHLFIEMTFFHEIEISSSNFIKSSSSSKPFIIQRHPLKLLPTTHLRFSFLKF